jgi:NitT/TauT family transport system permease protein
MTALPAWLRPVAWSLAAVIALLAALAVAVPGARAALLDGRVAVLLAVWGASWALNARIAAGRASRTAQGAVALIFGATLLALWELVVRMYGVPAGILPAPTAIAARFANSTPTLWADFVQTFVKGALSGYAIGCAAAFATAIAVDRSPFLQRGLLPVGNFVAALPVVGIAPILVMWFGFDWQSKAAVVVVMVFFPMLVNCVEGLKATEPMQRDLMATYSASYWQSLRKLRLPAALPFIFNGLKIATTLAMIGAIVAEFFGSPVVGMGFRISTEVGRLALDMVWSEIAVAALAGSAFYGLVALIEKRVTFWHPSQRSR